jgi:hypothetical protein
MTVERLMLALVVAAAAELEDDIAAMAISPTHSVARKTAHEGSGLF